MGDSRVDLVGATTDFSGYYFVAGDDGKPSLEYFYFCTVYRGDYYRTVALEAIWRPLSPPRFGFVWHWGPFDKFGGWHPCGALTTKGEREYGPVGDPEDFYRAIRTGINVAKAHNRAWEDKMHGKSRHISSQPDEAAYEPVGNRAKRIHALEAELTELRSLVKSAWAATDDGQEWECDCSVCIGVRDLSERWKP